MKVGLTATRLDDPFVKLQLHSMLEYGCPPDFVIQHGGSFTTTWGARFSHYRLLFKEQRLGAPLQQLRRVVGRFTRRDMPRAHEPGHHSARVRLSEEQGASVEALIARVPIYSCPGINDPRTVALVESLAPCLVACNSGLVRERVLQVPGAVFLNVHVSRLPQYRGVNNVEWALWHGDPIFATIHAISPAIDEGDILLQERIDLAAFHPASIAEYRDLSFWRAYALVGKAISGYQRGELRFIEQPQRGLPLMQYYVMHQILRAHLEARLRATGSCGP